MNKRAEILMIKKRETPALREAYELNEHLINEMKHPIWTCKFMVVRKRPNECVRKREGARAYKQCVHNHNMINYK